MIFSKHCSVYRVMHSAVRQMDALAAVDFIPIQAPSECLVSAPEESLDLARFPGALCQQILFLMTEPGASPAHVSVFQLQWVSYSWRGPPKWKMRERGDERTS